MSRVTYKTHYEVEILSPPYMEMDRPIFSGAPRNLLYGQRYSLTVSLPAGSKKVQAALLDVGYSTHGVHMSQRWVELDAELGPSGRLNIKGPVNTGLYPPGELHVLIMLKGTQLTLLSYLQDLAGWSFWRTPSRP